MLPRGGLAEWSNAPHLKCGWGEIPSQVRILYPPQMVFEMPRGIANTILLSVEFEPGESDLP